MDKGYILIYLLVSSILLFPGCVQEDDAVVCNKPYIRVGDGCCLDVDDNAICDVDETTTSSTAATTTGLTVCDRPYSLVGGSCCLDINDNKICDRHETITSSTTTTTLTAEGGFLVYSNVEEGVRIKYPVDWSREEDFMGSVVIFLSPPESDSDILRENIGILTEDLSRQGVSLEEYTLVGISNLRQIMTDFNLLESGRASLAGNPAHRVVYTARQGQYVIKIMQIWTIKEDKAYVITYTAGGVDAYSHYLETIEEMIDSFEII